MEQEVPTSWGCNVLRCNAWHIINTHEMLVAILTHSGIIIIRQDELTLWLQEKGYRKF